MRNWKKNLAIKKKPKQFLFGTDFFLWYIWHIKVLEMVCKKDNNREKREIKESSVVQKILIKM